MPDRAPGFYWVRHHYHGRGGWILAELADESMGGGPWAVIGSDQGYIDADFIEIGPRVESPDEARRSSGLLARERDEVKRLEELLVGRDEQTRELRAKLGAKLNQVAAPRESHG